MGANGRLGLLLWTIAVYIKWKKKDGVKSKVEKIKDRFSYLIYLSIFLKKEKDRELMTSLSSELENLGPQKKKTEYFLVFVRQQGRR